MRIEELELVCREAAAHLAARGDRPVPPTVVLPLPEATKVVGLPDFPDDEAGRQALLTRFAEDEVRPANAPAYGFLAEGVAAGDDGSPVDVLLVVFGARGHHPAIIAAPFEERGLGPFTAPEPLEPTAMPFLAPIQRAVDAAAPPDAMPLP